MKTPALLLAGLLGGASLLAQTPHPNHPQVGTGGTTAVRNPDGSVKGKDGILMVKGQMMYLKSGQLTRVDRELKLSEGMTAMPGGQVVRANGETITLQEGQMVTLDGKLTTAPMGLGSTAPGSTGTQPPDSTPAKTEYGNDGPK